MVFHVIDHGRRRCPLDDLNIFGAHTKDQRTPVRPGSARVRQLDPGPQHGITVPHPPRHQIDRRCPHRAGDKAVAGVAVYVLRRADLHQLAPVQNADAVAHRHGFNLIVSHEKKSLAQTDLQILQLRPQSLAQLGIQRRQRLIHQEHLRRAHDGPPDRHPLHFAARQPVGLAVEQMADPQGFRHPLHPGGNLGLCGRADRGA